MFAIGVALAAVSIGLAWGGRALGWWGGQAAPSLQPPSGWKLFTLADGGFSIEFPGDAEPLSSDAQGLTTNGLGLATSAGSFTAMWADVPGVRADYGPAVAEGRAADMSATIVSQGDAEMGGLPGYQFVLSVSKCGPSIPGACRVTWRVLPVGNRLYQLVTVTPDPPGTNPLTDQFLTSFRLRQVPQGFAPRYDASAREPSSSASMQETVRIPSLHSASEGDHQYQVSLGWSSGHPPV